MSKKNHPIIVGVAQFTQRKDDSQLLDPLSLMANTCQMALDDTGVDTIRNYIDTLHMVNIDSWSYKDAPAELSKILEINTKHKSYLVAGGESPQLLVNRAAKAISSGKCQAAIITGGEAEYSVYREKKKGNVLPWPKQKSPAYKEGTKWLGTASFETKYGLIYPSCSYAIFETALRASSGRNPEEHKLHIGKLFEQFSKIASKNPYSWLQHPYTAEEITCPSPDNRKVNYPYTKRMCANKFVDQSGALIMTSEELAEKLEIDPKLWVNIMGGADLKNIFTITKRPHLHDSPATREGSRLALEQAGLKLKDINIFDIYSCFPSIVQIIKNELGLSDDDPRDITVTGGLPYFGGPMSNYSMHSIITTVNLIRKNPDLKLMIIANGGYNTKQSIGIYGTDRPVVPWSERNDKVVQESILAGALPEPIEQANGQLTVEGYTIYYDRDGSPRRGIAVGRLENGGRTIAVILASPEKLKRMEQNELVGEKLIVNHDSNKGRNLISIVD